jgi:hypothetical protein
VRASFRPGIFKLKFKGQDVPGVNNGIAGSYEITLGFVGLATFLQNLSIGAVQRNRPFFIHQRFSVFLFDNIWYKCLVQLNCKDKMIL